MKSAFMAVSVGVALFVSLIGCSSALRGTYPDVRFPLPLSEESPALLFPIDLSHLGAAGNPAALGGAVADAIINKFGARIIADQRLLDLVGSLSSEMPQSIDNQVRHGIFAMTGAAEAVASNVATVMEPIVAALVERGRLKKPIQFKYIIAIHSHGQLMSDGAALSIESFGGIYDTGSKQIVACQYFSEVCANDEKTILAKLPTTYTTIIDSLINGVKM